MHYTSCIRNISQKSPREVAHSTIRKRFHRQEEDEPLPRYSVTNTLTTHTFIANKETMVAEGAVAAFGTVKTTAGEAFQHVEAWSGTVKNTAGEAFHHVTAWGQSLELGLKLCQSSIMKTSDYGAHIKECDIKGNCTLFSVALYKLGEFTTAKYSNYFCSLDVLDNKIAEVRAEAKTSKDPAFKEEIKEKLEALKAVREEFVKFFGDKINPKNLKIEDMKHLAGSKTYKHADPAVVHVEEEQVSA